MKLSETTEAYLLGVGGLSIGLWEHYKPEMVIGALVGSALAYDLICKPGNTISEGVDRLIEKHPLMTRTAIGYTALHLANFLPAQIDGFHQAFKVLKGLDDSL